MDPPLRAAGWSLAGKDKVCVHTNSASTPANSGSLKTDGLPSNSQLQHLSLSTQLDSKMATDTNEYVFIFEANLI